MMEGWKYIKLGDIIHIKHGYGFKGKYFVDKPNNNLLLTPGNFAIGGGYKSDKMKFYDGPINEEFVLKPDDVIVTMTDLSKQADTLGYSAKIPNDPDNTYLHNQRLGLISLKTEDFDLNYVYWLLRTDYYQRYIAGSSSGATVKHTSPKKIYSAKLLVPESKETQRKIASILSAYDDLIENNLKRIQLLEEQAQQTYEEWFVRLKFPGHETTPINEEKGLPEGWENFSLGELIVNYDSKRIPISKMKREKMKGEYPYYGAASIMDYVNDYLFDGRFVLMGEDGTVITKEGYPKLQFVEGKIWVNNHAHVLEGIKVSNEFLFLFLNQYPIQGHITGVAQPKINQKNLNRIRVNKASDKVQSEFDTIVKPLFGSIFNIQNQNQLLKEARDILLPRLMTGLIDVEELELVELKEN